MVINKNPWYIYLNLMTLFIIQITELKATHFTTETELRNKMKITEKEHDDKVGFLNARIQSLLKEVATLSKGNKRDRLSAAKQENANNSGSGTDSPSTQ